jgi:histidyl-tRNA synthetase
MKELGGADTPSVGVGMGIERALIALEDAHVKWEAPRPDIFVVCVDEAVSEECEKLASEVRNAGYTVVTDPEARSLRAQLRQADRVVARRALILGPDEVASGVVQVRNLDSSDSREVPRDSILSFLQEA